MKVYSYIVAFDYGFSPNPFHGVCTLACCKPAIRRTARVGDLVVGLSRHGERVVYAMKVGRVLDFDEYWNAARYGCKRPRRNSTDPVVRRGDNIYQPWGIGEFRQLASDHSNSDGTEDLVRKRKDLSGVHVLSAERFGYFVGAGRPLPPDLAFLKVGRGHKSHLTDEQVARVARWFAALPQGIHGLPTL